MQRLFSFKLGTLTEEQYLGLRVFYDEIARRRRNVISYRGLHARVVRLSSRLEHESLDIPDGEPVPVPVYKDVRVDIDGQLPKGAALELVDIIYGF